MKYHRLGGLNKRNYFLTVLEARSLRSRHLWQGWCDRTGLPNFWDLMPDYLRWGWCNNNRNKMHNKSSVLESSWNHPPHTSLWKNSSMKLVPGAKKVGDHCDRIYKDIALVIKVKKFLNKNFKRLKYRPYIYVCT